METKILMYFPRRFTIPPGIKTKPNFQYRPILKYNIIAIESHKNQFYYLTNKAVLSNSFGVSFIKNIELKTRSHLVWEMTVHS